MPEQVFLNEAGVYVSNTRVVMHNVTYATAHLTSVRTHYTPPNVGCALAIILFGAMGTLAGVIGAFRTGEPDAAGVLVAALMVLIIGIVVYRSQRAAYQVAIVNTARERQVFTSQDGVFVQRIHAAVVDALDFRS
jgi:hypothetical protein